MNGRISAGAIADDVYLFVNSVPVKKPKLLPTSVAQHKINAVIINVLLN
jgi:hypothetical protein